MDKEHELIHSAVHTNDVARGARVWGKHTDCVVFHSITTLEVVNMVCCLATVKCDYMMLLL